MTKTLATPATAGQRAGAYLIDIAIVAAAATAIWFTTGSLALVAVTVIELWAIGWIWEGHTGATPGNLVCGIRSVQRDTDVSVGALRLLPRSLVMGLAHIVPVLLPVGLSASGLLDGLAGARVIDIRRTRVSAASGAGRTLDLTARVTGADSSTATIADQPGVITQTPLTAAPAAIVAPTPTAAPAPHSDAGTVPAFVLSDGTVIQATGLGFIGRAPRAPESIPDAILIRVPDSTRSLSRTHAAFGIEDGQLWVQDLGSANGASVRRPDGTVAALAPHVPSFLAPGDVLVLDSDAELAFRRVAARGGRATGGAPDASPGRVADPQPSAGQALSDRLAEGAPPAPPAPAPTPPAAPVAQAAAASAPAPASAPAVIALQFQDGTTVPIHGLGYIGRAPRLPDGERTDAALVAVPDGDRSVSRTHGRFGIVDGQTWFEDLGSGNGSSLRTEDGRTGPMTPHQRFGLTPGTVLQLGECVIRVIAV
ncbi:FHA domain-containing protein [Microbacterium hydrocarbonoxydans]|uniref:FHA domain-containing protein n=1 Tax=Microbacterium hydrocarbonoxydans TaxID=273678 RepID=UPI002041E50A|nr:FHA domain-containing protein [Microbacterium hydrocarbonoxydans]MCM3778137.1 FHA domain-containing protein [Microbacterium hydrocarbonoxydans]